MKLNLDVRRRWECPECGRTVKRHGDITSLACDCGDVAVSMRLVEPQREFRPYQPYLVPEVEADELIGDEDPAPEKAAVSELPVAAEEVAHAVLERDPVEPKSRDEEKPTDPPPSANAEMTGPSPQEPPTEKPPVSEAASPSAKTGETTEPSSETSAEKPGRKGKRSRRRRSSRKRSRRRGSQGGKKGE